MLAFLLLSLSLPDLEEERDLDRDRELDRDLDLDDREDFEEREVLEDLLDVSDSFWKNKVTCLVITFM